MKNLMMSAAFAGAVLAGGTALAGNPAPAPVEPVVIVADTADNSGHVLVPLLALIFMAAGLGG